MLKKSKTLQGLPPTRRRLLQLMAMIISPEVFENSSGTLVTPRTSSNNAVSAHFYPFPGWNVKFEGMQNNSGIHGRGHVKSDLLYIKVETVCLAFADNEVIYGAEIIEVPFISDAFEAAYPGVIRVGKYMALKLKDNGEGQNAASDQASLYFITADFPLCDIFPPEHPIWYAPPFNLEDVPGQIQVK